MERSIALIAHDGKKADLIDLVRDHLEVVKRFPSIATGTSGLRLRDELGLHVDRMSSGPFGGDLQIGSRIVDGTVQAVIFLRDPLTAHPHEPDIQALMKVCDLHQVPIATNLASGRILLAHLAGVVAFGDRHGEPGSSAETALGNDRSPVALRDVPNYG